MINAGGATRCRYNVCCWRVLCPYRHSGCDVGKGVENPFSVLEEVATTGVNCLELQLSALTSEVPQNSSSTRCGSSEVGLYLGPCAQAHGRGVTSTGTRPRN